MNALVSGIFIRIFISVKSWTDITRHFQVMDEPGQLIFERTSAIKMAALKTLCLSVA
ncbi:hypothetical protein [Gynuella sunshinyii]|uniref:Uncharacterized protein n=1 Tax=Gynuella sunshinyii YC6258 TaxID=1445510 RepID=A0A0C5VT37_9GAMM|nr:hypothetical protein [Gynuella sunshinyii]AJQ97827.1 hypothetical Protein YC6258_05799 [Gynuella sunshinyii YC6258]